MSSISILATRCRPLTHRLLNARSLVVNNPIIHHLSARGCQQARFVDSAAGVRCVATVAPPASVSETRKPPARARPTDVNKPFNAFDRSERVLWKLSQSPVTMPFVSFAEIEKAIDAKLTAGNALLLMKSCSRQVDRSVEERVQLIDRIWQFLKKSNSSSAALPYCALIESYRCCGKAIDNPHPFLAELGAPKEVEIYEELIQLMCSNNDSIDAATDLLQQMKTIGLTATERAYNALIVGVAAQTKSMEATEEIIRSMRKQQVTQTLETQAALIKANIECGNEQRAIEMLKQRNDMDSYQLYAIIRLAAMKCTGDGVVKNALHLLPAPILNAKLIAIELQNICMELLHASSADRYYDPYELIIRHLPQPVFLDENTDEYGMFMIKAMVSLNVALPRLVQFSEHLIASERNTRAIHHCCEFAITRNLPNAPELLKILATKEPLRSHYFWPMFARAKSDDQVFALVKLAADTKTDLDTVTIEKHILSQIPHTVNDSTVALKTLERFGLKMFPLRTALIAHLLQMDRPHEALNIAKSYTGRIDAVHLKSAIVSFITRNNYKFDANAMTVAQLIRAVQSKTANQRYDLAGDILYAVVHSNNELRRQFTITVQLIQDLVTTKVKISAAAADAVLNRMSKQRDVYALCVEKIRGMIDNAKFPVASADEERPTNPYELASIQDMEDHLIELESNQMNTRGESTLCTCHT